MAPSTSEADGVDAGAPRSQEFRLLSVLTNANNTGDGKSDGASTDSPPSSHETPDSLKKPPPPARLTAKELDDVFNADYHATSKDAVPTGFQARLYLGAKAFVTEGHTAWDSLLSNASATVGQVIQVYPHQVALMGIVPAMVIAIVTQAINWYTLWLLIILFLERKRHMVELNKWYDTTDSNGYKRRKAVTQFHDLIGHSLGQFFFVFAEVVVAVSLFGTGIAQIVASSSSQYTIDKSYNKLEWGLILGAPLLLMGLLPSFRSVRIINIIALAGTNYSCLYFFIYGVSKGITPGIFNRGPVSVKGFFLGAATVAAGGHTFQIEMMDAMRRSRKFAVSSFFSVIWNLMLLVPHSFALVLALPGPITKQSNIYAVLPNSNWKTASVWLMYIHNVTAFSLHFCPLLYMWEKLIRVHHRHIVTRLLARLPILGILWLVALAIPFYGTINSLFSALTNGLTGYVLPCLAFNWYFRTKQRRDDCVIKIPGFFSKWDWKPIIWFNYFLILVAFGADTVCGIVFAVMQLAQDINTFKWFATCYQCPVSKGTG